MKKITNLLILVMTLSLVSCKTQQLQTKTSLPKIENQLKGELDYTKGGFELVQWQKNGDEITLGTIDKEGVIHLNLPEYDIQALAKENNNASIQNQFNFIRCKGKGEYDMMGQALFKTPYDDVYSQFYAPMSVKKYGAYLAYINPVSDEQMLTKNSYEKIVGANYYWVYIDRDLHYKDMCIKEHDDIDFETDVSADIQFKKGWNFIKKQVVSVHKYGNNQEHITPKKILFTLSSPKSKDVIWHLVRKMDEEKILAAKKEYELTTPISKK